MASILFATADCTPYASTNVPLILFYVIQTAISVYRPGILMEAIHCQDAGHVSDNIHWHVQHHVRGRGWYLRDARTFVALVDFPIISRIPKCSASRIISASFLQTLSSAE